MSCVRYREIERGMLEESMVCCMYVYVCICMYMTVYESPRNVAACPLTALILLLEKCEACLYVCVVIGDVRKEHNVLYVCMHVHVCI